MEDTKKENMPLLGKEYTEAFLEEIFDKGFATYSIELTNKIIVKIKSLSVKDYFEIDHFLNEKTGSKLFMLQAYGIAKLSKALIKYNNTEYTDENIVKSFLENLPAVLVDKLLVEQNRFEKSIAKILEADSIEENFFETPGSGEK